MLQEPATDKRLARSQSGCDDRNLRDKQVQRLAIHARFRRTESGYFLPVWKLSEQIRQVAHINPYSLRSRWKQPVRLFQSEVLWVDAGT